MDPDAFLQMCPSRGVLTRIGEKWCSLILAALSEQPKRFGALKRRLDGVSQKMLSQSLRHLERDGLVSRTVIDTRPLQVEYALTELGHSLVPHVTAVKFWAEANLKAVEQARQLYDSKA